MSGVQGFVLGWALMAMGAITMMITIKTCDTPINCPDCIKTPEPLQCQPPTKPMCVYIEGDK